MTLDPKLTNKPLWKVSLHGGHSGEFCDHAEGTLREMLEAAVAAGMYTFGVSEHAPRGEAKFLYDKEKELGWDVAKTETLFDAYTVAINALADEFADRLVVLRGFEAEVVPTATYRERFQTYRTRTNANGQPAFDFCVGSVHYINEISIDGPRTDFLQAAESCGGLENFAVRYYETVAEMISALRPDVVGHLDLVKLNGIRTENRAAVEESPRIRAAAENALEAAREYSAILDLNTAGWRKNLGEPYPAPWLVARARAVGVPFCFGVDSHRATEVDAGLEQARTYLLQNGVSTITAITRENGVIVRRVVPLN